MPNFIKFKLLGIFIFGLGFLFFNFSYAAVASDLELERIFFSTEEFISGSRIRIYARVENLGEEDVVAYVTFWNGSQAIGNSQLVSLRAGGLADEVFLDFVVPDSPFNIRAVVNPAEVPDPNSSNNEKLTTIFTPLADSDRDGIPDLRDNCPNMPGADQADNDGDGQGNLCDPDDDNDGLTDAQEAVAGTNPFSADTDRDGIDDVGDAYPLDRSKSRRPPPPEPPEPPEPEPEPEPETSPITEQDFSPSNEREVSGNAEDAGEQVFSSSNEREVSGNAEDAGEQAFSLSLGGGAREGGEEEGGKFFWSFGNPVVAGIFWTLVAGAIVFLVLERMIGGKYARISAGDEAPLKPSPEAAPKSASKKPAKSGKSAKRQLPAAKSRPKKAKQKLKPSGSSASVSEEPR